MNKNISLPRNWRNNNPLNIRRSKDQWQGLADVQNDKAFCQFRAMKYGWRAAFMLLCRKYYYTYRLVSIRQIISRWAPATENDTCNYTEWVAAQVGIDADQQLPQPDDEGRDTWLRLALAMALYEGMLQPNQLMRVNIWEIVEGWGMSLPPTPSPT